MRMNSKNKILLLVSFLTLFKAYKCYTVQHLTAQDKQHLENLQQPDAAFTNAYIQLAQGEIKYFRSYLDILDQECAPNPTCMSQVNRLFRVPVSLIRYQPKS